MSTETMASILSDLEAIDEKKANLRKALEDLHAAAATSTASSSPTFANLKWEDMDAYFTNLQSQLRRKFSLLETPIPPISPPPADRVDPKPEPEPESNPDAPVLTRPELKPIFEKMDAIKLRDYLFDRPKERNELRLEIAGAWKHAPDPAKLALDTVQEAFGSGRVSQDTFLPRRVAMMLLQTLMEARAVISPEVEVSALEMAFEWKKKLAPARLTRTLRRAVAFEDGIEKVVFLQLVATYKLVELLDMDDLIGYVVEIAGHREAIDLCHALGFADRISDVIQKLIDQGKQNVAVKFIYHFELTDKFPPVPLLRASALATKKVGHRASLSGKDFRTAYLQESAKAISALKAVIKIIEDHNLESQLPKEEYVRRIEKLEQKRKFKNKKRNGANPGQPPAKQQKQGIGNHPRPAFQRNAAANSQPPRVQMAGFPANPYQPYGPGGFAPSAAHEAPRTHVSYSGDLLYPSEPVVQPGYYDYDRPVAYNYGYNYPPPEFHPSYFPQ